MIHILVRVLMLMALIGKNESYYSRVLDKADNILYLNPNHANTVADLSWCEESEPCAIVSKRFWLPRMVTRLCRCKNLPCNMDYSIDPLKHDTIQLDNRSQFKMCDSGEDDMNINRCPYGGTEIGISVEEKRTGRGNTDDEDGDSKSTGTLIDRKVYAYCRCISGYWQLSRHTLDKVNSTEIQKNQYHCKMISRCKKNEFCGHIREDTHSSYYRCSCPQGTLCISTDKTLRNASELLYDGPMYRAFCHPIPINVEETSQQK